jgi:hypothetical protein
MSDRAVTACFIHQLRRAVGRRRQASGSVEREYQTREDPAMGGRQARSRNHALSTMPSEIFWCWQAASPSSSDRSEREAGQALSRLEEAIGTQRRRRCLHCAPHLLSHADISEISRSCAM